MGHCATLRLVIYLDCSIEKMEERILKRGKASERVDDNLKSLRRRFDTHRQVHNMQSMPLLLFACTRWSTKTLSLMALWYAITIVKSGQVMYSANLGLF